MSKVTPLRSLSSATLSAGTIWIAPCKSSPILASSANGLRGLTLNCLPIRSKVGSLSGSSPHRNGLIAESLCSATVIGIDKLSGIAFGELRQASSYANCNLPVRVCVIVPISESSSKTLS